MEIFDSGFPNLTGGNYEVTSPVTDEYNCIAWAAEDPSRWWWPIGAYWPPDVPRFETVESFIKAFKTLGFVVCDNGDLEEQFVKIALYVNGGGVPTHMARQLRNGRWTSKIGRSNDISHQDPYVIADGCYGTVNCFLKKGCV